MRDEVLTVLNTTTEVFQDVLPCSPVDGYQHFGGKYCCNLQSRSLICSRILS